VDILEAILRWSHLLATVLWIGLVVNSALIFQPLFREVIPQSSKGAYLEAWLTKSKPLIWIAIVTFAVSGGLIMILSDNFKGFSNYFANSWTVVMTLKHVVVFGMVFLGIYQLNGLMPQLVAALKNSAPEVEVLTNRNRNVTVWLACLAVIVLLMTAIAEMVANSG
jgi:uncharacterized membrane protein